MGTPLVLVENFASIRQFSGHTLIGNEEPAGTEAFRAADGRRTPSDYWAPSTLNASATLTITCDRLRAANMIALDRGHNLIDKAFSFQCSDDNTNWANVVDITTLPTVPGGSLDAPLVSTAGVWGVRTEEGAWLCRFPTRAARYWRLSIPAMGTGLRPQLVGWWLGMSYAPSDLRRPLAANQSELLVEELTSERGWQGRGAAANRRLGMLHLKLTTVFEYDLARYHLEGHFGRGRPMWLVHDDSQAERAVLAIRPAGTLGFELPTNWFYPAAEVGWVEYQPKED
jgi:hypothetical protein